MSQHATAINQYLSSMGIPATLAPAPGAAGVMATVINHLGVNIGVFLIGDAILLLEAGLGYPPAGNLLPFYRRLLVENSDLIGVAFCVKDQDNSVAMRTSRQAAGLDAEEFKSMIEGMAAAVHRTAVQVAQEFPFQQRPAA